MTTKKPKLPRIPFASPEAWAAWLEEHYTTSDGLRFKWWVMNKCSMTPESRQDRRNQFLRTIYDLSNANPNKYVYWKDVAPRLGWDHENPELLDEALAMADYLASLELISVATDDGEIYRITALGIDEVEGKKEVMPPSPIFQFYGDVQSSIIGTQIRAQLTANFNFEEIEREIEQRGEADTDELREALEQVMRLMDEGQTMDRGVLARFGEVMRRNSWFTSHVAQALVRWATQST
jgi:hypothetical protein